MKAALFVPVILLTAVCAAAQYTPPNQSQSQSYATGGIGQLGPDGKSTAQKPAADLAHTISRCPISMSARQGGGLRIERAQEGKGPSSPFLTPSLTLQNPQDKRIVSASVTALGSGPNQGATPLRTGDAVLRSASNPQQPRLSRSLTIRFTPDGSNTVSGQLYLPGFVILDSIALNSVTFADGSTQNFATAAGCSVQPSPFLLVSASK